MIFRLSDKHIWFRLALNCEASASLSSENFYVFFRYYRACLVFIFVLICFTVFKFQMKYN